MPRRRELERTPTASFAGLQADWQAAKRTRFRRARTGLPPSGSGADYHYRSAGDYLQIMEWARDFDRNDVIVGATLDKAVANTVQGGFSLDPQTPDKGLNRELAARWLSWAEEAEHCDLAGENNFSEMERAVFRAGLVDGDMLGLLVELEPDDPQADRIELIEAHRVRTPSNTARNVVHGVLLDEWRRRLEYWVTKEEIGFAPLRNVGAVNRHPVRNAQGERQIVHHYDPKRISQTRGVSIFAPIFDACGMFEDINFAMLVKQQAAACFAFFRELPLEAQDAAEAPQRGERTLERLGDGSVRVVDGIGPGMEIEGRPGEKLQGFSPNIPSQEFFAHMRLILTLISVNLGLPLVITLLDGSETNFSGWRGALEQAKLGWKRNQKRLEERFHVPIYRWRLRRWAAADPQFAAAAERLGEQFFWHRWNKPTWPYIDPGKDAAGDVIRLANGLAAPSRVAAERNLDYEDERDRAIQDLAGTIRQAKAVAAEINQEFPDDPDRVSWRDLAKLPTPQGVQLALNTEPPADGQASEKAPPPARKE